MLDTVISPELVPCADAEEPGQCSEDVVGPFCLQDFTLYYVLRFGFAPPKAAFLSWTAWRDKEKGLWPDIPEEKRKAYAIGEIKRWLAVFIERFFEFSQYKRSCIANGPKVGSGGSLSPRGDWRAPSDARRLRGARSCPGSRKKTPRSSGHKDPMFPQFPSFKPIGIEDRELIEGRLKEYRPETSELNFSNMFLWRLHYGFEWSLYKEWLLVIGANSANGVQALPPIGPPSRLEASRTLLAWLRDEKKMTSRP